MCILTSENIISLPLFCQAKWITNGIARGLATVGPVEFVPFIEIPCGLPHGVFTGK
jgi:hypothetical protein